MSTDTDRLDARLSNVEGTMEQMNERLGSIDSRLNGYDDRFDTVNEKIDGRFSALDAKVEQNRREMRRWILVLFAGLSLVFTLLQFVL